MRQTINGEECFVCRTTQNLHIHEIFFGRNRKTSIKWGMCVYLCGYHHNQSNEGVHFNKELDTILKITGQQKFEEKHSREKFMGEFMRNYL